MFKDALICLKSKAAHYISDSSERSSSVVDFHLHVDKSRRQANTDPEARSQDSELEQQPTLRDDLLCYITAVVRLPPPTAPIENPAILGLMLPRRDRLRPPPHIEGQKKTMEQKANPPRFLDSVLIKHAVAPSHTRVKLINNVNAWRLIKAHREKRLW